MKNKRIGIIPILALLIFIMGTTSVFALPNLARPTFTNITGSSTYATPFIPAWTIAPGAASTATLDGVLYTEGTAITTERSHTLIVTVTMSGYNSSNRSIQFYTETPPTAPTMLIFTYWGSVPPIDFKLTLINEHSWLC